MNRSRNLAALALSAALLLALAACGGAPGNPAGGSAPTIAVTPSSDLQTVVTKAPSGSTLALSAGDYTLPSTLAVDKDLTLKGAAAGKVTLAFDGVNTTGVRTSGISYAPVVHVTAGTFTASHVTFAYTGTAPSNVVLIENAKIVVDDAVFKGGVSGSGSEGDVGDGLFVAGNATGTVSNSRFTGNQYAGIAEYDGADVTIQGGTSSGNHYGALFWGTAQGTLSGVTLSGNSQAGVLLDANSGGPTPTLDGNTIENNGGDGITYTHASAGTASNNTIDGNGDKGIRVLGTSAPTLSSNDIHDNPGDGLAFNDQSGGTAKNNRIHNNGDKGIRVLGSAAPTLTDNQVTDNQGEGVAYLDSSAGGADGNTVSGNHANGLTVANQASPTLTSNSLENNDACGLLLQDTAAPKLANNLVTGNGSNVCDQRSFHLSPIASSCPTSDNSLNPDPGRYLAVVVEDDQGNPVSGVQAGVVLLRPDGSVAGQNYAQTDASGVALVADTTTDTQLTAGTQYSALLEAAAAPGGSAIVTACGNVPFPGTVVLQPHHAGAALTDLQLNVSDGGNAVGSSQVMAAYPWGPRRVFNSGVALQGGVPARILPGDYTFGILARTATDASYIVLPETVNGPTTLPVDVASQPTAAIQLSMQDGSGAAGSNTALVLFSADPNVLQERAYAIQAPTVHVTPGNYWSQAVLYLADPSSSTTQWWYNFRVATEHFAPAGSSFQLQAGGPLSASIASNKASYAPGDQVLLTPTIVDAQGDHLQVVGASTSSTTALRTLSLQPTLSPQAAGATLRPQAVTGGMLTLTVTGPNGSQVYQEQNGIMLVTGPQSFTLPAAAASGTYTVSLSADLGPYRNGPLTATSTFDVP